MFNDFKNLTYRITKQKIQKLKDIFDRLGLSSLEERYNTLLTKFNSIDTQIQVIAETVTKKQEENPNWPNIPNPPIPPVENLPDLSISISSNSFAASIEFIITVTNIGTLSSPDTTVNIIIPSLQNSSASVPSLDIGESYQTKTEIFFDPNGQYQIITGLAEVNQGRSFKESNYNNNQTSLTVLAKTQYVPDGNTYVILHAHTPEGFETASLNGATILTNGTGSFASTRNQHGVRQQIYPGTHHYSAEFNGMSIDLGNQVFAINTTTILTFTFPRTEGNLSFHLEISLNDTGSYNTKPPIGYYGNGYNAGRGSSLYNDSLYALWWIQDLPVNWPGGWVMGEYSVNLSGLLTETASHFSAATIGSFGGWNRGQFVFYSTVKMYGTPRLSPITPILPQTTFNSWFVQSITSGSYPSFYLMGTSPHSSNIICTPGYNQTNLPTAYEWTSAVFDHIGATASSPQPPSNYNDYETGLPMYQCDDFMENSGTTVIKIASVPYNMLGIGW